MKRGFELSTHRRSRSSFVFASRPAQRRAPVAEACSKAPQSAGDRQASFYLHLHCTLVHSVLPGIGFTSPNPNTSPLRLMRGASAVLAGMEGRIRPVNQWHTPAGPRHRALPLLSATTASVSTSCTPCSVVQAVALAQTGHKVKAITAALVSSRCAADTSSGRHPPQQQRRSMAAAKQSVGLGGRLKAFIDSPTGPKVSERGAYRRAQGSWVRRSMFLRQAGWQPGRALGRPYPHVASASFLLLLCSNRRFQQPPTPLVPLLPLADHALLG